jgi:dihydroorotase
MTDPQFDLLIRAGRVFLPDADLPGPGAVAVRDGRFVTVGADVRGVAEQTLEFPDAILLPGLIDLHAHPARSGSVFGVDPDRYLLPTGVATVLSQGDAGADNLAEYVRETIAASRTRVRLAINLSRIGESTTAGCFARLEDADVDACVAAIEAHREYIWGIAVNTSHHACGDSDPREILSRGLRVAEQTGLRLLYGMRRTSDIPFDEQLDQLRPGDVVTYCFRREPHCIIERGRVHPAVRAARERGVLFDVGHGTASFCFDVAEAAIGDDFPPDTISTDLQRKHVESGARHDLPLVMSKLRAACMRERDVLNAVTRVPAQILNLDSQIGALSPGLAADLAVLRWSNEPRDLIDAHGDIRQGGNWEPLLTVRDGRVTGSPSAAACEAGTGIRPDRAGPALRDA